MQSTYKQAAKWLACAVFVTAYAGTAAGAPINYGDFSDVPPGSVMYLDVTEDSATDPPPPPLFGAPSISGNLLDFDPKAFGAYASGSGPFSDTTDGQLNFTLMSGPAQGFTSVGFSEGGDFSLTTLGGIGQVSATLAVAIDILEVDGVALPSPIPASGSVQFVQTTPYSGTPFWSQDLLVDLAGPLATAGISYTSGVTKAEIVLNNTLQALAQPNTATEAFIAKKDFKITTDNVPVPEPGTVVMLASLLVGAGAYRRLR